MQKHSIFNRGLEEGDLMAKKLIVIDGFDRTGKDTLLKFKSEHLKDKEYVYFNDLTGKPSYKDKENYLVWLNNFLTKQRNDLVDLSFNYDTVYMVRLDLCDKVYSKLFNREYTAGKYFGYVHKRYDVKNFVLLWKNYAEYMKRLERLGDKDIEYNLQNFEKIQKLYNDLSNKSKDKMVYITADDKTEELYKELAKFARL